MTPKYSGHHNRVKKTTASWAVFSVVFLVVAMIAIFAWMYFNLGP
jgi:hypothetical protein